MKITHYTVNRNGRTAGARVPAAESQYLMEVYPTDEQDGSVIIPEPTGQDDIPVAIAAKMAAHFLMDDVDDLSGVRAPLGTYRVTLYNGEHVVATAAAVEDPVTADDLLEELTQQIDELTRLREAVTQITAPEINRVRHGRTRGLSNRTVAGTTGYSHTQIAHIRSQPMRAHAVRWRALNLLAEAGLDQAGVLHIVLATPPGQDGGERRAVLGSTPGFATPDAARAALVEQAAALLRAQGMEVTPRRVHSYHGVPVPEYWITPPTA